VSTLSRDPKARSREHGRRQLQRGGIGGREAPVQRQRDHARIAEDAFRDLQQIRELAA